MLFEVDRNYTEGTVNGMKAIPELSEYVPKFRNLLPASLTTWDKAGRDGKKLVDRCTWKIKEVQIESGIRAIQARSGIYSVKELVTYQRFLMETSAEWLDTAWIVFTIAQTPMDLIDKGAGFLKQAKVAALEGLMGMHGVREHGGVARAFGGFEHSLEMDGECQDKDGRSTGTLCIIQDCIKQEVAWKESPAASPVAQASQEVTEHRVR